MDAAERTSSVDQWAQLVLTIERSCSAKQRFDCQGSYAIGPDDKRELMVIKRATKSKAAQRKGAISNWKVRFSPFLSFRIVSIWGRFQRVGKLVLYLLKEQQATAESVRLRRVSHQSVVLKPKAQFDHMLETLAWERDIDLLGAKALSASNPNLNLSSTQNTQELTSPSPPPPQFVMGGEYPTPSSIPQRIRGDQPAVRRSEFSELRSRPSFINYEDFDIFHRAPPPAMIQPPIRRASMMPVDADGYKDLLLDVEHLHQQDQSQRRRFLPFISRGTSNTSIKSKTTETSTC